MGKVEKWVVLGVLALIVGILVVSLTVDDPLRRENVVLERGAGAPGMPPAPDANKLAGNIPPAQPAEAPAESKRTVMMNSSVSTAPAAPESAVVVPEAIPAGSILKTAEGLEPSFMPDTKFYTWKAGDTFPALAQRYYGDLARLGTLRRVNEGRTDVQPGDRVMIPVFDPDLPANAVPSAALAAPSGTPVATPKASGTAAKLQPALTEASGARVHVVTEGESLWVISKKELGSGSRWKEIYDANRDQLSSPEALHTGLKLRVP